MEPLFASLPENLSELTVEELTTLLNERLSIVALFESRDEDTLSRYDDQASMLADVTALAEQCEALREAIAVSESTDTDFNETLDSLVQRAGAAGETTAVEGSEELASDAAEEAANEDADEDAEADAAATEDADEAADVAVDVDVNAETSSDTEPAAVDAVTAAASLDRFKGRPPAPSRRHQPMTIRDRSEDGRTAGALTAAAGIRGIRPGQELDRATLVKALLEAHRTTGAPRDGRIDVVVASAMFDFPSDRRLSDSDPMGNLAKILAVTSPEAIQASGGRCAPFTPLYDLPLLAVADRPVRDGLPTFNPERGGIQYPTPIGLADVAGAVGVKTAEQDAAGGTTAEKPILEIDCEPFQEAETYAVTARVRHGNFGARSWPERVANITDLVEAYHARIAETELLDAIGGFSTATADEAKYGAFSTVAQGILKAGARYRSRHRMRSVVRGGPRLRVLLPDWLPDMMVSDFAHGQFDRQQTQDGLERYLGSVGYNVSWYMDTETGEGQIAAAQSAGALDEWFTSVVGYLFAEGTFIFLDGGRLDTGITRDSILNATNDFEMFWETFEGLAMPGYESIKIDWTVCPNGTVANPATAFTC